jgi:hypothetical protein
MAVIIVRKENRRISNLEEVIGELFKQGFIVNMIQLEILDISAQIELVSSASIFLGVHGQGMTLSYFCHPNALILEYVPYTGQWSKVSGEYKIANQVLNHQFFVQVNVPWNSTLYNSDEGRERYLKNSKEEFDLYMKEEKDQRPDHSWRAILYHTDVVIDLKDLEEMIIIWKNSTNFTGV